jgi:Zn-dependent protease
MQSIDLARLLNYTLAMVLSLSFHEAAHAFVAFLRGDATARSEGRMTLNPLAHIDWFGTILLPLLGALTRLPVIGWAKPVPVDTRNLRNPKWDYVLVAAAGPAANLLLSFGAVVALFLYGVYGSELVPKGSFFYPLTELSEAMVWVNVYLALFNLLPIPPLDGGTVFGALLPDRIAAKYHEIVAPYGTLLLIAIIASGGLHWLPGIAQGFVDAVILGLRTLVS